MATILKAAPIAQQIVEDLTEKCQQLIDKGCRPNLKVILVGEHPPSVIYTRNKKKFMENLGAECEIIKLPEDVSEANFLHNVEKQASNENVHGLFVQLPLPKHLSHIDVGQLVPPEKDVDGFHAKNLYQLMAGDSGKKALISCTPKGVLSMLSHAGIELEGKNVAVIGRSLIVGKPLSLLLTNANATVTLCHSRTRNLKEITKRADIIIAAIGKAKFVDDSFLRDEQDQILIDVGINHDKEGKLCGDIDQAKVEDKCSLLTPVPGGVGKMTIVSLGQNLISAAKQQLENSND
jgi:methylenetetrahydrofolate dehydrogenase (NADP+)/methenyltetrahydrofolate cyclohydrolase